MNSQYIYAKVESNRIFHVRTLILLFISIKGCFFKNKKNTNWYINMFNKLKCPSWIKM